MFKRYVMRLNPKHATCNYSRFPVCPPGWIRSDGLAMMAETTGMTEGVVRSHTDLDVKSRWDHGPFRDRKSIFGSKQLEISDRSKLIYKRWNRFKTSATFSSAFDNSVNALTNLTTLLESATLISSSRSTLMIFSSRSFINVRLSQITYPNKARSTDKINPENIRFVILVSSNRFLILGF